MKERERNWRKNRGDEMDEKKKMKEIFIKILIKIRKKEKRKYRECKRWIDWGNGWRIKSNMKWNESKWK